MQIPLFPLNTVLFPGGPLKLRVFEQRYLEMVSNCLRQDSEFGVCLIREGEEVGQAATPQAIGTLARIVDWEKRDDGLLGITILGTRRFRILRREIKPSQLAVAEVETLAEPETVALPAQHQSLVGLLKRILEQLGEPYSLVQARYEDAVWVGYRLAEILPFPLEAKQTLLELDDPLQRLEQVERLIHRE
ncbi:peptidase S16 [Alkalilimnicola ehrlichii]|uniref:Peptidase S16 n=1 Tax=Alkalilimnicola ehrlichii TaxID=351052 RepID=A0A3E0X3J0_9GAMM|nr:LON peptidase substrate-binding domain-containing protein [Alkalilimnicola ehrlichii]RFA31445.1 peptidase S16 [Alkalilimnicola ehrlichii]RFA39284.1 peptidase S16 [Alkalilimnicola ehrlichii]